MTPEEASNRYHWCKYDKSTNTIELYLDHYMLSCLRTCEAKFYLEHLLWIKPKRIYAEGQRKPWFFDFGEYIHWCLEQFYNHFKINKTVPPVDWWLDQCKVHWQQMDMDGYANSVNPSDVKKYEEIKGWLGVCSLLTQYYVFYMDMRLRVIDTEITFGHNKEVYLGNFQHQPEDYSPYRLTLTNQVKCYLTGRIDLLVDNGYKIGPVDHKTTHKFDGFEHNDFNPHDAMTGYILAIHEIISKYDLGERKPESKGGWIFHISACTPATPRDKTKQQGPRFKTTPIDKTTSQLEDFKQRQLSTFKRVCELLFNNKVPEWTTNNCHNMFFRDCEYVPIHEQPSEQWSSVIERFYEITNPWDTRNHVNKEKENALQNK
jgi:PD-(D/E)XK nuclease superfamily